ncbi:MAG: AMP-binding protein, partial [Ketobacteraceae bacterium]|nr:AMP-binding protein [Ketobacteraceae bacterium]
NDYQVTCMFGSPSLIHALGNFCKKENIELTPLRMVSCGGAPMTLDIMRTFRSVLRDDAVFETTWGATEGLPLTSVSIDTLLGEAKPLMDAGKGVCIGAPVGEVEVKAIKITEGPIESWSDALEVSHGEVGELIVRGPNISPRYHNDPVSDKAHKIPGSEGNWHRTGDLGWFDDQGRVWFGGRSSHQVSLNNPPVTLYSVQSEGVTNNHPNVYRSALVCAFADDERRKAAVMCIELTPETDQDEIPRIKEELLAMMEKFPSTQPVKQVLFHPSFPVDIRHNAKIERHILGRWATQQLDETA